MTSRYIKTCVAIVLHILALFGSAFPMTYDVVPETLSTPCPESGKEYCSNLTLSQYARDSSNFDSSTTLILLPGNHSLEMEFFVRNIPSLTIISAENISNSDTVLINCSQSARFRFENITVVSVRGLELTGCVNNVITFVEQFTVEDCNLRGQSQDGTGLGLYNVTSTYIVSSSFSFFTKIDVGAEEGGGALLVFSSTGDCDIVLNSTSFSDNTVTGAYYSEAHGGAVQATNCNITLKNNCSFINNRAVGNYRASGGAIWVDSSADPSVDCAININNSKFINNTANGGKHSIGGAVLVRFCRIIITNSLFDSNSAVGKYRASGGAVTALRLIFGNVIVDNSMFINNIATSTSFSIGGALDITLGPQSITNTTISNSMLTLKNSCSFINNRAVGNYRAYGGALWVYSSADPSVDCVINIDNSNFINNTASSARYSEGGAVLVQYCSVLTVNNSLFESNSANGNSGAYGGAIEADVISESRVTINNSMFIKNIAASTSFCRGGAVYIYGSDPPHQSLNVVATISNSGFLDNTCRANNTARRRTTFADGGALMFKSKDTTVTTTDIGSIIIHNNSFCRNTATSDEHAFGGALLIDGIAEMKITESQFFNNTANGNIALAGAILNFCAFRISVCDNRRSMVAQTSVFHNNSAIGDDLSIGGAMLNVGNTDITLSNCEFMKNRANSSSRSGEHGLGGVVASSNGNLYLNNSRFTENVATGAFGGVLTLANCSLTSYGFLDIVENTADTYVLIAINSTMYFSGDTAISNNTGLALQAFLCPTVIFSGNTSIENNNVFIKTHSEISQEGGTVTGIYSTINFDGTTNIMYNTAIHGGAISATQSNITLLGSVTIAHNKANLSGGGIYALQSNLYFVNTNRITMIENDGNETGGGIHAVSSTLWAYDGSKTYIVQNHAERGGGVCLESNSKLYIFKNAAEKISNTLSSPEEWIRLEFRENTAEYGGAVYITDDTNSETCSAMPFSGESTTSNECFIQGLGTVDTLTLINLDRILGGTNSNELFGTQNVKNTYFFNNTASKAGNSIYGGLLDRCKINPTADTLFNGVSFHPYNSMNATSYLRNITLINDDSKEISSAAVRVCFCRNNQSKCRYTPEHVSVYKGQRFNVSLVAVDQLNNTILNATKIHGFVDLPARLGEGESIQQTNGNGTCTNLTYSILSSETEEQLFLYADGPCMSAGLSLAKVNVSIESCPVGFVPDDHDMLCACDPLLLDSRYIQNCSIDNGTVFRREGVWFDHSDDTGYILHKHCPFDYCVKSAVPVNLSNPDGSDSQCDFNRSGKLCGSCKENYSLSLGNSQCISDSKCDNMLALLIVFALAGVALVAFILVCNLTVAVGTINGLIFYANILTTNRATFLPFGDTSIGIFFTVFIAWLNLDFGIVTCFYEEMNAYEKEWYQIIFPLYIILMVAVVIIACEYSTRIARFFTKTHPVAALATLILLSYTKSLRLIIAAFSPATLMLIRNNSNNSTETVWLIDASISYFEWKRTPFLLVAVLILLVGIAYTLFLFSYQWLLRCSYNRALKWIRSARFYPFMDAYHAPYNKKYRYWTGLLLFVRAFLYIIAAANVNGDPSNNLLSISITMAALRLLKMVLYSSVYKSWLLDILEISFIFNLLIFSVTTLYIRETGGNQAALAYTSTSIAFITFLIILLYHTYAFVLPKKLRNKLDSIKFRKAPSDEENDDTYDIKPAQENKCTYSVVDPIPPIPPLAEVKALFKPRQKEDSSNEDEPKYAQSSHASKKNSSNNEQNNYSMAAKGVACENKSSVPFANPYITDEDQRGLERETEINEIIEIAQ